MKVAKPAYDSLWHFPDATDARWFWRVVHVWHGKAFTEVYKKDTGKLHHTTTLQLHCNFDRMTPYVPPEGWMPHHRPGDYA